MTQHIGLKPSTLQEIPDYTQKDNSLLELIKVIKAGWPETKGELSHLVLPFFDIRDELSACDGIVIRGERVVVPKSLRRDMFYRLHYAHSGVVSTLLLARASIYWPGMSAEIKQFIEMCDVCRAFDRKQPKETLIPHEVPGRPLSKVGVNVFTYRGRNCLICVDYYSSFWEIDSLDKTTSGAVVQKLKSHFARNGILETCVPDNGPQFTSTEFKEFSRQRNFVHVSSPAYPQSQGKVEAAVNSAKNEEVKKSQNRSVPRSPRIQKHA